MLSAVYIVPTPIGNLDDITKRAVDILQSATLIAAEDTRHSRILLDKIGVGKVKMLSCNDHNEDSRVEILAQEVEQGGVVALISDAGTPMISDPGYKVISKLVARNIKVFALPGPCAAITALCAAALPTDKFLFLGFLPVKDKELRDKLFTLKDSDTTTVFYESPRRILNTLEILCEVDSSRQLALCREMTKTYETIYRMSAQDLLAYLKSHEDEVRGEFVLVVGPKDDKAVDVDLPEQVKAALAELLPHTKVKVACKVVSDLTGINKNKLYEYALSLKGD